jgi:FtsP/CotA-like multicopper oxidase with cupredoxin domain/serine/threonine protein kinase
MQVLRVDQHVGSYRIERQLERGHLHISFLARHPAQTEKLILTVFIVPERFSPEARQRFLQRFDTEASALASLRHPHLLPVYDYGEQSGYPYLVTPYMAGGAGGSLAGILKQQGRCSPAFTQEALEQIAAGVEYLHSRGVMHGMLMPSNMLLSKNGMVLVAGFGLVSLLQKRGIEDDNRPYASLLSIADTFPGKPEYLAPELAQGYSIDIRSEVYASGVMLFELLAGRPPFSAAPLVEIGAQRSMLFLHQLCPDLPVEFESIVNEALAHDPAQRFQRVSELAAAFSEAYAGTKRYSKGNNGSSAIPSALIPTSQQKEGLEESTSEGAWQFISPIISGKLPAISVPASTSSGYIPLSPTTSASIPAVQRGEGERSRVAKRPLSGAAPGKGRRARPKHARGMSRRQALTLLATGGVVAAGSALAVKMNLVGSLTAFLGGNRPMRPSFPRAASTGVVRAYTFEAAPAQIELGGQRIATWAYNGMLPGPEIRLTEGDTLRVTVKNRLPEGTTIHWHGVPLVNSMDGVPGVTQQPILPGQDFVYTFVTPAAGTYLYHSHAGLQLDRGLYGPLIIQPKRETMRYDNDFVVVLDDWLDGMPGTPEDAMKQLIKKGDPMGSMMGMGGMGAAQVPPDILYPLYLINGRSSENPLELVMRQGQKSRMRFINASASTIYRVALQGHRMTVTHTDGQPVEPVEVDTIRIGMGERYDVLVSANNPGVWQLAAQAEGTKSMVRAIARYKGSLAPLPPATYQPPELMRQLLLYNMLKAAPGIFVPPGGGPDQVIAVKLSGGMGQYVWKINDQIFDKADPIVVGNRSLIRFQFNSQSMMPHPMHLHGHFFQVDNGTGRGPLKDTVLVDPKKQLTINWVSDNPGTWAFHCHNRYHENAGMMRVVKVQ